MLNLLTHAPRETVITLLVAVFLVGVSFGALVLYVLRAVYFRRNADRIIGRREKDLISEAVSNEKMIEFLRKQIAESGKDKAEQRRLRESAALYCRLALKELGL